MAFEPEKIDYSQINNGEEYGEGSLVSPTDINNWFKSGAYSQKAVETFTENVDISELNNSGEPFVGIIYKNINGKLFPYLKLANLKGKTGDSGLSYGASLSNKIGESETDGYTKSVINSIINNPNLLINGDFRVNQRGLTHYTNPGYKTYTVDRWYISNSNLSLSVAQNGIVLNSKTVGVPVAQIIEDTETLLGKTITLSCSVDGVVYAQTIGKLSTTTLVDVIIGNFGRARVSYNSQYGKFIVSMIYQDTTLSSHTINWVKLEYGIMATPNSPRPYAEELAMCQRYYQKLAIDTTVVKGKYTMQVAIPLITTMRDTYTVTGALSTNDGEEVLQITGSFLSDNVISLQVKPTTIEFVQGQVYNIYSITNGISLDGEL